MRVDMPGPGGASHRLLVFAPHPDDASLAAGGLMQQWENVTICHVTAGDGYWRAEEAYEGHWSPDGADYVALGRQRWREAQEAAGILHAQRFLLGFPDACLMEVLKSTQPFRSPFTRCDTVPYSFAVQPGVAYTAANLVALFRRAIQQTQPQLIVAPSILDENETHHATAMALREVWKTWPDHPPVWSYIVHAAHGFYPGLGLLWNRQINPSLGELPGPHVQVSLTRHEERIKYNAIDAHATQMAVLGPWLNAFVSQNEVFHPEQP